VREILLTQGQTAWIDDDDFEEVSRYRWHAHRVHAHAPWYAVANLPRPRSTGRNSLRMHMLLMGEAPEGKTVDHRNGNGLDNRRSNLRWATVSEQRWNSGLSRKNTSGFKGVSFDKSRGKYRAQIRVAERYVRLGRFMTAEEAAQAYDRAAREAFGAFARLNFGDD